MPLFRSTFVVMPFRITRLCVENPLKPFERLNMANFRGDGADVDDDCIVVVGVVGLVVVEFLQIVDC